MTDRASEQTQRAHPPTIPPNRTKGSDHDRNHHATEQDGRTPRTDDGSPAGGGTLEPASVSGDGNGMPAPTVSIPPQRHTSQISEESRAYWRPIVAAMDPMTSEELADVAEILRDIDARLAAQENAKPRES